MLRLEPKGGLLLDNSKRVFLSPSCLKDEKILEHIFKVLGDYKFPEKNIIKGVDMDILTSGDYLVRHDSTIQLFEIRLTLPFGYTTHYIVNL